MNYIFKFIAFPVTFCIGIISMIFVLALNHENIKLVAAGKIEKEWFKKRLFNDFDHFFLYEFWKSIYPFVRAIIAIGIYYYFFIR